MTSASPWLTSDEAARYLGLPSRRALYQRVRRGQVKAHRFGRSLRFHREELDRLLAEGTHPVTAALQSMLRRPSARQKGDG